MAYYTGDIPGEDIVIEPARDGAPIDLDNFNAVDSEVIFRDFEGNIIAAAFILSFSTGPDGDLVILEWPTMTPFESAGLYSLSVVLVGAVHRERLAPIYLVAQDPFTPWHTVDSARNDWDQAPDADARLFQLLAIARNDVEAFGTTIPAGIGRTIAQQAAQLMQARNLWNANRVDPATGAEGQDTFAIRPFPLDWQTKQVLRPHNPIPVVQ